MSVFKIINEAFVPHSNDYYKKRKLIDELYELSRKKKSDPENEDKYTERMDEIRKELNEIKERENNS